MLGLRLFGRRDRHHLHLGELVLADHAARVASRRARLGAEAGGQRRETHRQRRLVDDAVADEVCERHLGGGDQPVVVAGTELVVAEFRELRRAEHGVVPHQQRRVDLQIAVLARVQVEHVLAERPMEASQRPLEHDEARARQLRRRVEVHEAQTLADLEMLARRKTVEHRGLADTTDLDVVVFVPTQRHIRLRLVRNVRQRLGQRGDGIPLGCLQRRGFALEGGDLGLQPVGRLDVLAAHRLADLLGGRVAALLEILGTGDSGLAGIIEREEIRRQRREAAPGAPCVEGRRVLPYPSDIVHGSVASNLTESPVPAP